MDFLSRDRYRQAVEELAEPHRRGPGARGAAGRRERAPGRGRAARPRARRARRLPPHRPGPPRPRGRRRLPAAPRGARCGASCFAHATAAYLAPSRLARPRCCSALGLAYAHVHGRTRRRCSPGWRCCCCCRPARWPSPASSASGARFVPPRRLPRLDFAGGVPDDARTMVVVPTLLTSVAQRRELLEHLEVLALGNLDPRIHFAILSDFADAPRPRCRTTTPILAAARERRRGAQRTLRRRGATTASSSSTGCASGTPREGVWMGWERKRGKIEEFNRLLRGATDTSFAVQVGDARRPAERALLPHARLRHAAAARRGAEARSASSRTR